MCALALACAGGVLLFSSAAGAAPGSIVTITAGPAEGETVASNTVTFAFESNASATFQCTLDGAAAESCDSGQITYTDLANGSHTFDVIATTTGPDVVSGSEKRTWTVAVPPQATITEEPPNPSESTDATFSFTADQESATFECSLDGATPSACTSPVTYNGLSEGQHVFAVRAVAQDAGSGQAAEYRWEVRKPPPAPVDTSIVTAPPNPSKSPDATFGFTSTATEATFQCSLDGKAAESCTSPAHYSGLASGHHTFRVTASSGGQADESPAEYAWSVNLPPLLDTRITSKPSDPSTSSSATFEFTSNRSDATFECSLDGAGFAACTSPTTFERLSNGEHAFQVRAVKGGVLDTSPAEDKWTVEVVSSSSGTPWGWIIVGIVAALAIAAGIYYFLVWRRRGGGARVAWQSAAVAAAPPERCQGDGDYVWRRNCRLKPALRHIEAVTLHGTSATGTEISHETGDYVVGGLNRAAEALRLQRSRNDVLEEVSPVSVQLLSEAEGWTAARDGAKIAVRAKLAGGSMVCEFKRFKCVAEGPDRVWKPVETWTGEVEDEPDEIVGEIRVATGAGWLEQDPALVEALLAFVEQVDVPDVGRPPENSPTLNP